jgi:hypothetical protein
MDAEITISFDVQCDNCGKPLNAETQSVRGKYIITVEPCRACLREAESTGREG